MREMPSSVGTNSSSLDKAPVFVVGYRGVLCLIHYEAFCIKMLREYL